MKHYDHILIEGIDRLGKSTLIENIIQSTGFRLQFHLERPEQLNCYTLSNSDPLQKYQLETYRNMFSILQSNANTLWDRAHLGEVVYAPKYRNYSGDYVYTLEDASLQSLVNSKLILLYTSDLNICTDDGLSFDFSARGDEQQAFKEAYAKSKMPNKVAIDVHDGLGRFKDPQDIMKLALK